MLLYANYLAWLGTGKGSNTFPSQLKYSEIKLYSKKVDKENSGNYTPVAILISFSRVFEKFAFNQLAKFFFKTTTFDNSQRTTAVLYDLSWAFDIVCVSQNSSGKIKYV